MKTVIIKTRAIYYKVAEVTIEVPDDLNNEDVRDWVWNNENMFVDELDQNLHDAPLTYGFGLDDDFEEIDSASETRYDVYENGQITFGGHC
jgi:putative NIF3 family GTP cyclohydrolase 1 type 2